MIRSIELFLCLIWSKRKSTRWEWIYDSSIGLENSLHNRLDISVAWCVDQVLATTEWNGDAARTTSIVFMVDMIEWNQWVWKDRFPGARNCDYEIMKADWKRIRWWNERISSLCRIFFIPVRHGMDLRARVVQIDSRNQSHSNSTENRVESILFYEINIFSAKWRNMRAIPITIIQRKS